jgi:hypothetical protein
MTMKLQKFLPASIMVLASWALSVGACRAGTVLYDNATVVTGQEAFVQSFTVATPGTLTITLSNIPWLDVVADLDCFLTTTTGVVGPTMLGAGSESVKIGAGTIYAHWFGDAQGTYNAGVLGVKIQFQPASTVSLPASLILLLSGLGVLFGWQRRRTPDLAYLESIPSPR